MAEIVGVVGFVAAALAFAAATIVYRAQPESSANRRLAIVLVLEGQLAGSIGVLLVAFDRQPDGFAPELPFLGVSMVATMLPWFYLLFLGTLRSPLVRWLSVPAAAWWLLALALAAAAVRVALVATGAANALAIATLVTPLPHALVSIFALVVSISAYRRAGVESLLKRQARAYVVAFGTRDVLFGAFFLLIVLDQTGLIAPTEDWPGGRFLGPPIILLVYIPLVAYGAVRWQLLDLDLRIKAGIRRGTSASVVLAAFVVATVMAENFLTQEYGWVWGGLAAGLLLFALSPLQRLGQRLAEAALPGVEDTPAYRQFRAMEAYKAAVEHLVPGGISAKERRALDSLRERLHVSSADATLLEREAARSQAAV